MKLFDKGNYVIGVKLKKNKKWYYFYEDKTYGIEATNDMGNIIVFKSKKEAVKWWYENLEIILDKYGDEEFEKMAVRKFKDVAILRLGTN